MSVISFARGVPSPDCLPVEEIAECAQSILSREGRTVLNYGPVGGYGPLREAIAESYGVEPGAVFVSNGSLQGIVFLAQHLLADGPRRVLIEAPCYDRTIKILGGLGAELVPVAMDDEGLDPEAVERALDAGEAPAFVYSIPTFQNPSGRTLSAERRQRLVELLRDRGVLLIEDNPYGRVRFDGEPVPTMYDLAGGENVVYSSSFSKILSPGIRVGYLLLPPELVAGVEARAVSTYVSPGIVNEAIVFEFMQRGLLQPNIDRVCDLLRERRDAMLESLERAFPEGVRWSRPEGGYFLWLDFPDSVDAAALLGRAEAAGVTFVKGADFFTGGDGGRSAARLAFSFVSPDEIRDGIARLGALLPATAVAPV
jgi:DNA-binding transcriptional MocR family regulator